MPEVQNLPALTNLIVCVIVTLIGLYWIRTFTHKYDGEFRFVFRAYVCWWLSWMVWTATWFLIAFFDFANQHPNYSLALSDLNAVLLIMVYAHLTRASAYSPTVAIIDFTSIVLAVGIAYLTFGYIVPDRFSNLHVGWALCLSAFSTLLIGWGFSLRYGTSSVLIIGFVYAFAQPLAFESIFAVRPPTDPETFMDAFLVVLAILKVIFATAVTIYFAHPPAASANAVAVPQRYSHPSIDSIPAVVWLQTGALLTVVLSLALIMTGQRPTPEMIKTVLELLAAIATIITFVTGLGLASKTIRKQVSEATDGSKH